MGCNIHTCVEKRTNGGKWIKIYGLEPFRERNYGVFGFLAGVRNYSDVVPISEPRGLPNDVSEGTAKEYEAWGCDAHSASWLSVAELGAFDYDASMEDRRCTKQVGPNIWSGAETCSPGHGKRQTFKEFLGSNFFVDIQRVIEARAGRIVFWFDN